jgi:hypothetical protein
MTNHPEAPLPCLVCGKTSWIEIEDGFGHMCGNCKTEFMGQPGPFYCWKRIDELEKKLAKAREALEKIGNLSDADKDHTFVIAREALREMGEK